MHARFYNPQLGRFLSVDPADFSAMPEVPQSWNRYAYVLNKPLSLIDPYGLAAECPDKDKSGTPICFENITVKAESSNVRGSGRPAGTMDTAARLALGRMQLESVTSLDSAPARNVGPFPLVVGPLLEAAGRYLQGRAESNPEAMAMMPLAPMGVRLWPSPGPGNVTINGITYRPHAQARMMPVGFVGGRGVPPSVVENAIKHGAKSPGHYSGTVVHRFENVTVVTNTSGNLVYTVIKTGR
jgi:hypothetical protein